MNVIIKQFIANAMISQKKIPFITKYKYIVASCTFLGGIYGYVESEKGNVVNNIFNRSVDGFTIGVFFPLLPVIVITKMDKNE